MGRFSKIKGEIVTVKGVPREQASDQWYVSTRAERSRLPMNIFC